MIVLGIGSLAFAGMFISGVVLLVGGLWAIDRLARVGSNLWKLAKAAADDAAACRGAYENGAQLDGIVRDAHHDTLLDAYFTGQWCVACRVDFGVCVEGGPIVPLRAMAKSGSVPFLLERASDEVTTVVFEGSIQFVPGLAAGRRLLREGVAPRPPWAPALRARWAEVVSTVDLDGPEAQRFYANDWDRCISDDEVCAGLASNLGLFDAHRVSDRDAERGCFIEWTLRPGDAVVVLAANGLSHDDRQVVVRDPWVWLAGREPDLAAHLRRTENEALRLARRLRGRHWALSATAGLASLAGLGLMLAPLSLGFIEPSGG